MRAVIMRVSGASVEVEDTRISSIENGLVILLAIGKEDREEDAVKLARKVLSLRIFPDEGEEFSRSVQEIKGEILVVSQFTLYGDISKGRRPSFDKSASREKAEILYRRFISELETSGIPVKEGKFGAHMHLFIENDGPVTLIGDTDTL